MIRRIALVGLLVFLGACDGTGDDGPLPTQVTLDGPPPTPTVVPLSEIDLVGVLKFWEAANGVLAAGQADGWRFIGETGDAITVRVLGIEASLALFGEDESLLSQGERLQVTLPAYGIYTVVVQPLTESDVGYYQIGLGYSDRPNPAEAPPTPLPEVVGVPTPAPGYVALGTYIGLLTGGTTVGATMDTGDPDHVYTFDGAAGEYIQLQVERVMGEIDPVLTLYSPAGSPIAMDDDSGGNFAARLHNIRLPDDGVYTVQVGGSHIAGGYSIRFQRSGVIFLPTQTPIPLLTPSPTAGYTVSTPAPVTVPGNRLEAHTPVTGFLNETYTVAIHPIYIAAGEIITVGVRPAEDSAVRPYLDLRSPQGELVAQASATAPDSSAVIASFPAPLEGAYQAVVTAADGSAGQYVIAYGRGATWEDVLQGEAARDEVNEGEIARRGARDVWTLELRAGDIITAAANPVVSATFDPILELALAREPGTLIAIDDNSGGGFSPFIQTVTIPETGLYLLRVYDAHGTTIGSYRLIWRYINVAPTATPAYTIAPVLVVDDRVPNLAYRFYSFQGHRGQRMRVRVIAIEDGFDPVAVLIGPDGTLLTEVDDTEGDLNPVFILVLPEDGTYQVRVNGYLNGGAFRVFVEEILE